MQVFGQVFRAGMQVPGQVFRVGMQVFGQVFRVGMQVFGQVFRAGMQVFRAWTHRDSVLGACDLSTAWSYSRVSCLPEAEFGARPGRAEGTAFEGQIDDGIRGETT